MSIKVKSELGLCKFVLLSMVCCFFALHSARASAGADEWIDVSASPYYAVTDTNVDVTSNIQEALDRAVSGATIYFPPGTYSVTNLKIPDKKLRFLGYGAIIEKRMVEFCEIPDSVSFHKGDCWELDGGNSLYLIASYNWVYNSIKVQKPIVVEGINFNGQWGAERAVFIHQGTQSVFRDCIFKKGKGSGLLITSETKNGLIVGENDLLSNNKIINCRAMKNTIDGITILDPPMNLIVGTKIFGGYYHLSAGWAIRAYAGRGTFITGIHTYSNTVGGLYLPQISEGTILSNLWIEDGYSIRIKRGVSCDQAVVSNSVLGGTYRCDFLGELDLCVSMNNRYRVKKDTNIFLNNDDSDTRFHSVGDIFMVPDPFEWKSSSSNGVIYAEDSYNTISYDPYNGEQPQ